MNANLPAPVVRMTFSVGRHPDAECARLIDSIDSAKETGADESALRQQLTARLEAIREK